MSIEAYYVSVLITELCKAHHPMTEVGSHDQHPCAGCANEALDEYPEWPCAVIKVCEELQRARGQIDVLVKQSMPVPDVAWEARAGVIRALHPPETDSVGQQWCPMCIDPGGSTAMWPCPTLKALDGERAQDAWQDAEDARIGRELEQRLERTPCLTVQELGQMMREVMGR